MPTDPTVQTVPAGAPPADSTQPLPEDAIKAHPLYQDLEKRYAAAHKEIDGKKTKKELEAENARLRVLAGEATEAPPIPPALNAMQFDSVKLQADIEWNIANKEAIKLAGQSYADFLSKGYEKQDALDLALSRMPTADRSQAENLRAQAMSSSSGAVDRTSNQVPEVPGISKGYIEAMRKKYPKLPEERLLEMIQSSVEQSKMRGV